MSGKANVPKIKGQDVFKGEQQHSSQHHGPDAYAGKKVVVIGANNSAHDICAALWEHGADVTMVQRSSTHIVRSDSLIDRKSTRLNSSHLVISYAVFCLKKKKHIHRYILVRFSSSYHSTIFNVTAASLSHLNIIMDH